MQAGKISILHYRFDKVCLICFCEFVDAIRHRRKERLPTMKTIDITPTWTALILPMVEVLKNPKADPQAKKEIQAELLRLAKIADDQNEKAKKGN